MTLANTWQTKTLKQLAAINYGKSPAQILDDYGQYPVLGTGGEQRRGNNYLYEGDSIILGRKGTIDRVFLASGKFWTIDTAYYLSNFVDAFPRWLFYSLQTQDLRQLNEATGVPSLARETLYKIQISTPPPKEQEKIAEILSTMDRAIEQTEALIAKQECIKTGLMQDLLTSGIDEHGNLRLESTHEFKESPLGRIPIEWDVKELASIVDEGITYGIVQAGPHIEGGIPYIRTGDMAGNSISVDQLLRTSPKIAKSYTRSQVHIGDIVFALRATVGKVLPIPDDIDGANLTQGTAKISPGKSLKSDFLLCVLKASYVQKQIQLEQKGTTFMEITLGSLRKVKVAVPRTNDEQVNIAKIIMAAEMQQEKYHKQMEKLSSIKTALMQDLLTGKKRVTPLLALNTNL